LREAGVSFQRLKTWKQSRDPHSEAKKNRVLHLYGLMDGTCDVEPGDPEVVICVDEFGPLNLQPHPGRQWATRGGGGARPRRRRRATYTRPQGVRHLLAAYDLSRDRLYGHIKPRKRRGEVLTFCRYLRSLYPPGVRIGLVLDNASAHLSTRKDRRVGQWAAANNVELAYTPTNASYLNRIEGPSPRCATSLWTAPTTPATPAGQHDPPLHHLAKPQRARQAATRNRQQGERCLKRH
jgi:transposase